MKTYQELIILFSFIIASSSCIAGDSTWIKILPNRNGALNKVIESADNNFVAVGSDYIPTNQKIYIVKFNIYGDTIWTRLLYNDEKYQYSGEWIEKSFPTDFIITGSNSKGINTDAYLLKTNSTGNKIWDKLFGSNHFDVAKCVRQETDAGFIMLCRTSNSIYNNMMLLRTDALGNLIWQKQYLYDNQQLARELELTSQNGYIFTGVGFNDMFVINTDSNGDTLWTKRYGGNEIDEGYSIQASTKGGFILAGTSRSFNTMHYSHSYIVKIDINGGIQWQRTYSHLFNEICYCIREVPNIGYVFCGTADSSLGDYKKSFIRIIDFNGNLTHQRYYTVLPYFTEFISVVVPASGGLVLCGVTQEFSGSQPKMIIARADSFGNIDPVMVNQLSIQTPTEFELMQNFPNPFNSSTKINFSIFLPGYVSLRIYNVSGKQISVFHNIFLSKGTYNYILKSEEYDLSSGAYFYELEVRTSDNVYKLKKKMIHLK